MLEEGTEARSSRESDAMAGLFLEGCVPGLVIKHPLARSITEHDNMMFSLMTMNPQPLHIDFDFARRSEWGRPLVNSMLTLSLMVGISVHDTTLGTLVGNLGMTDMSFPHPVFHGDTIRAETEVVSSRPSRSKPDRGIAEFRHRAFNQDGVLVAQCLRQSMLMKRPAA